MIYPLDGPAVENIRFGLTTTDMGLQCGWQGNTASVPVNSCNNLHGDDGALMPIPPSVTAIDIESGAIACPNGSVSCPEWFHCEDQRCVSSGSTVSCVSLQAGNIAEVDNTTNPMSSRLNVQAACLVQQGTDGCGIEQPLAAAVRATRVNSDFLVDTHLLQVIIVTDEDDCSAVRFCSSILSLSLARGIHKKKSLFEKNPFIQYRKRGHNYCMPIRRLTPVLSRTLVYISSLATLLSSASASAGDAENPSPQNQAAGQSNDEMLLDMSLEDLLDVEVDVVAKSDQQGQSIRTAPGVVTVINRDQILRMGAKDLISVLRQVPGFQIGGDSSNSYYMSIRGLWAFDGKVLVLLDGHEMNELLYSSVNLGNRFPLDWVQRIEIIRGPGSIMYGGSAAYGVVNIVTRNADEIGGVSTAASYSQLLDGIIHDNQSARDTYGLRLISASGGRVFNQEENLGLTLDVYAAQGMMSDRTYTDIYGDSYNMAGNSETGTLTGKLGFTYKGLRVSYLIERYRTSTRDGWGENLPQSFPAYFTTSSLDIRYNIPLSTRLSLMAKLTYLFEKPWEITAEEAKPYYLYWDPSIHRVTPSLTLRIVPVDWIDLSISTEYRFDSVKDTYYGFLPDPCELDDNFNSDPTSCKTSDQFHNLAVYAESVFRTRPLDISLGVRYEHNSETGGAAVPRGALTRSFERIHFKLLGSQAFRDPSINNLSYNPDLKRDRTTVGEAEIGVKIIDELFWTVNGFVIHVKDPIVYYYDDETEIESFVNYKKTGTTGFETELSFKLLRHFLKLGYSYYYPIFNEVETYMVPGHDNVLLAFAKNKLTASGGLELIRDLSLNFSGSLLFGDRYGYVSVDDDGNSVLQKFSPELIVDVNLLYRNVFTKGLSFCVGGRNIANSQIQFIQPYDNGHPPNPGPGAEVFLKIGYDFTTQ